MSSCSEKPRFLADQMLGRLAKWLRLLGFDTKYFNEIDDSQLLRTANDESRILLTRDTQLLKTRPVIKKQISAILIRDDYLDNQLRQIMEELGFRNMHFSEALCTQCNVSIQKVSRNIVRGKVPSYVYKTQEEFAVCPECLNVFWKGTHWDLMRKKLLDILEHKAEV